MRYEVGGHVQDVSQGFDSLGRLSSISLNGAYKGTITASFDWLWRPVEYEWSNGNLPVRHLADVEYGAWGELATISSGGVTGTTEVDFMDGQLLRTTYRDDARGTLLLDQEVIGRDRATRILELADHASGDHLGFTYDFRGRLESQNASSPVFGTEDIELSYEPKNLGGVANGFRRTSNGLLVDERTIQLDAITGAVLWVDVMDAAGASGQLWHQDETGSVVGVEDSDPMRSFVVTYDSRRLPIRVDGPVSGDKLEIVYDEDGRLVATFENGLPRVHLGPVIVDATGRATAELRIGGSDRLSADAVGTPIWHVRGVQGDSAGRYNAGTGAFEERLSLSEPYGEPLHGSLGPFATGLKSKQLSTRFPLAVVGKRLLHRGAGAFLAFDPALASSPAAFTNRPAMLAPYSFAGGDPVNFDDPDGRVGVLVAYRVLESGLDVGSIAYDIATLGYYSIVQPDPYQAETAGWALTSDVACLGLPVAGGGIAVRAQRAAGRAAADALVHAGTKQLNDATRAANVGSEVVTAEVAMARKGQGAASKAALCFVTGTPVLMADGSRRPIESLEAGDWVLADDPEDELAPAPAQVAALLENYAREVVTIVLEGDEPAWARTLGATRSHPFWTEDRGWMPAGELTTGTRLLTPDGGYVAVASVGNELGIVRTFNLDIRGVDTYFVGEGPASVLVHNVDPYDIKFSQDSIDGFFQNTPDVPERWRGRPISEAVDEARRLGKLPDGLRIQAVRVNDAWVTLNNRTLQVAREANLPQVHPEDLGAGGFNKLQGLLRDAGLSGPVEAVQIRAACN